MHKIGVGTFTVTPRMRELVNEVLDSERISYGPMSREFEYRFAHLHGSRFGILSNSGTSSLHVALQTLKELHGWPDGTSVIVPACTFVATVNIVLHNKMTPILVDVEPDYYCINPQSIDRELRVYTRAIIPVHLFGQPADMEGIINVADQYPVSIIEDSCECMFASLSDDEMILKMVGSMGEIGCFSTYVAHLITSGVGGIATTNNPDYAAKMRSLVNHGRDGIYLNIDDDNNVTNNELLEIISRRFNFEAIGHSFRITELEAALALAQLEDWETMIKKRQANAKYLTELLQPLEDMELIQLPKVRPGATHSWMMYPILCLNGNKWDLCNYLEKNGIETREMLRLTDQPVYRGMWNPKDYPVAEKINRCGFYVGIHQDLTKADLDYMADIMTDWFTGPYI